MQYNRNTIFYRKERCLLEPELEARIPYAGYKARTVTDDLMDDDAVRVCRAFIKYVDSGNTEELKSDMLNKKVEMLINLRKASLEFMKNVSKIIMS